MKNLLVISSLILMTSMVSIGCGSASSCWTRNGSRVPTSSSYSGSTPVAAAPIMDSQMVYSSGCNACAAVSACNACNPCTAASCNPCDPCGTSHTGYPMGGTMPGPSN